MKTLPLSGEFVYGAYVPMPHVRHRVYHNQGAVTDRSNLPPNQTNIRRVIRRRDRYSCRHNFGRDATRAVQ